MHAPGRAIWLRQVVLVVMLCAATVSMARAQPPRTASSDLGDALVPGATVWITDLTGREEKCASSMSRARA
jgi:hypothetical protein